MAGVASMDGFVFSVDPLFQLEPGIRWFLQVSYSVQPVAVSNSRFRRQESFDSVAAAREQSRRGTNVRLLPLDWPGRSVPTPGGGSTTVLATGLMSAGLLVLLVTAVAIFLYLHYRSSQNKKQLKNRSVSIATASTLEELTPIKTRSIKTTLV